MSEPVDYFVIKPHSLQSCKETVFDYKQSLLRRCRNSVSYLVTLWKLHKPCILHTVLTTFSRIWS